MNNILVIDSNTDYYLLLKRKLKFIRPTFTFAVSIKEIMAAFKKESFRLIIVSHIMKNSSGIEIVDLLKGIGYNGPILIVTSDPKAKNLYLEVDCVLDKCISEEEFRREIKKLLGKAKLKGLEHHVSARD